MLNFALVNETLWVSDTHNVSLTSAKFSIQAVSVPQSSKFSNLSVLQRLGVAYE